MESSNDLGFLSCRPMPTENPGPESSTQPSDISELTSGERVRTDRLTLEKPIRKYRSACLSLDLSSCPSDFILGKKQMESTNDTPFVRSCSNLTFSIGAVLDAPPENRDRRHKCQRCLTTGPARTCPGIAPQTVWNTTDATQCPTNTSVRRGSALSDLTSESPERSQETIGRRTICNRSRAALKTHGIGEERSPSSEDALQNHRYFCGAIPLPSVIT
jgi:hypothetical protein